MRTLRAIHRWLGGLLGLLLATLGATGTLLLQRGWWLRLTVPHGDDPVRSTDLAGTVAKLFGGRYGRPTSVVLADPELGVHRLIYSPGGAGAYVDQSCRVVARWSSDWQRPDLFLLDLHRHLLGGSTGETIVGLAGLAGIVFVATGVNLWWRIRHKFTPRPLPAGLSRSAIIRHHRDLGAVVAPLLLVSFLTGAMMALKPVQKVMLAPFGGIRARATSITPLPRVEFGQSQAPNWGAVISSIRRRWPAGAIRIIATPTATDPSVAVRVRLSGDWLPAGATRVSIRPSDGAILGIITPATATTGDGLAAKEFPVHAAKVGGWAWRLCLTLSGLSLVVLGAFATMSFWAGKPLVQTTRKRGSESPATTQ